MRSSFQISNRSGKRGFTLLLILGILIILTLLVVGFLGHALSQIKAVSSYRAETDSLLLGDVAVNLVKTQIDDATSKPNSIWVSQPGAIRTYSNNGTDSNTTTGTIYKLYSSSSLSSVNPATDIPSDLPAVSDPNDWSANPLWTDLNAPVQKSDGTYAYPIIDAYNDPGHLPGAGFTSATLPPSFSITTNNVGAVTPVSTTTPSTLYPIPMPVRWLYILKQGQIITPDSTSTSPTATFTHASPQPTAANPIVGRVAYWTDDNTCRVNVNTASASDTGTSSGIGGTSAINTFWDTPRFTSIDDYALGSYQPYTLEYQRYSGHPATTTLTLALPEFADTSGNVSTTNLANVLALTPRYVSGGSTGATVASATQTALTYPATPKRIYSSINELLFNPPGTVSPRTTSTLTRQELETAKFFITAHSRAPELNLFGLPRVSIWPISTIPDTLHTYRTATDNLMAFCATTSNSTTSTAGTYYFTRYPWTNNANAAIPPLNIPAATTASVTGSNSSTYDVNIARNVTLLGYLDTLTSASMAPYPGNVASSGNSFDDKYTQLGKRQILTEMFDYVRITNSRDPGLDPGAGAYPGNGDMPYSAYNAYDLGNTVATAGFGQILPTQYATWGTYGYGRFQGIVVNAHIIFIGVGKGPPVSTPQTYPAGSYNAVSSSNVSTADTVAGGTGNETGLFYDPPNSAGTSYNSNNPSAATSSDVPSGTAPSHLIPPPGQTAVQAVIVFTLFDPAMGYARCTKNLGISTTGLIKSGTNTTYPTVPVLSTGQTQPLFINEVNDRLTGQFAGFDYTSCTGANPGSLGGILDFRLMLAGRNFTNNNSAYQSYSPIINMTTGGTFHFSGCTFTTNVYLGYGPTYNPNVNTYTFTFPAATLPVPGYSARPDIGTGSDRFGRTNATSTSSGNQDTGGYWSTFLDFANDTIISMVPNAATGYGDYRMLAGPTIPASAFIAHPNYNSLSQTQRLALDIMYPSGQVFTNVTGSFAPTTSPITHGLLVNGATYYQTDTSQGQNLYSAAPMVPVTMTTAATAGNNGTTPPDFDNGFGELPDGPYINKPDEGGVYTSSSASARVYYDNLGATVAGTSTSTPSYFFSPQRQVPSPVMFGSLPTGAPVGKLTPKPWQTLLFQPGATGHAGLADPKDEYFLDLFWMPQTLPYAISEPFSTAGKVNLNYQILPFTYIDRSTAIQSVLFSEKVAQVGTSQAGTYKLDTAGASTGMGGALARQPLNLSETTGTLRQFVAKFSSWSVFKTAAEICDVYLVPQNESWTSDSAAQAAWYGSKYALVGDNTRERPYADIYSRITTKSNSYTVYYRVQTLKNSSATPATWTEGTGAITGEFRGSSVLDRYLDPNVSIPDFAALSSTTLNNDYSYGPFLDGYILNAGGTPTTQLYYKWRVAENNRFAP